MTENAKAQILQRHGCLNRNPERVLDSRFVKEEFFDPRDLLQVKYEMVRGVAGREIAHCPWSDAFRTVAAGLLQGNQGVRSRWLAGVASRTSRTPRASQGHPRKSLPF